MLEDRLQYWPLHHERFAGADIRRLQRGFNGLSLTMCGAKSDRDMFARLLLEAITLDVAYEIGVRRGNVNDVDDRLQRVAVTLSLRNQSVGSDFQIDSHENTKFIFHGGPFSPSAPIYSTIPAQEK